MRWGLQDIFVFIMRRNSSQFCLYGCNYIRSCFWGLFRSQFGLKFRINVYMSDRIKNYLLPRDGCEDLRRWRIRIYPFCSYMEFSSSQSSPCIQIFQEHIQNYKSQERRRNPFSLLCLFYIEFMVYTYYETFNLYYIIRSYTLETSYYNLV